MPRTRQPRGPARRGNSESTEQPNWNDVLVTLQRTGDVPADLVYAYQAAQMKELSIQATPTRPSPTDPLLTAELQRTIDNHPSIVAQRDLPMIKFSKLGSFHVYEFRYDGVPVIRLPPRSSVTVEKLDELGITLGSGTHDTQATCDVLRRLTMAPAEARADENSYAGNGTIFDVLEVVKTSKHAPYTFAGGDYEWLVDAAVRAAIRQRIDAMKMPTSNGFLLAPLSELTTQLFYNTKTMDEMTLTSPSATALLKKESVTSAFNELNAQCHAHGPMSFQEISNRLQDVVLSHVKLPLKLTGFGLRPLESGKGGTGRLSVGKNPRSFKFHYSPRSDATLKAQIFPLLSLLMVSLDRAAKVTKVTLDNDRLRDCIVHIVNQKIIYDQFQEHAYMLELWAVTVRRGQTEEGGRNAQAARSANDADASAAIRRAYFAQLRGSSGWGGVQQALMPFFGTSHFQWNRA